jgi:hypothetical protein
LLSAFPLSSANIQLNFLSHLGVHLKQLQPTSIGVDGTPTLLLINKDGIVTDSWRGKLPPEKEREVIARL